MIVSRALAVVCSLLFHLLRTDGFSTFQTPSLGRSKNMELSSSFYRLPLSSPKALMDGTSVIGSQNRLILRVTEAEGEGSEGEGSEAEVEEKEAVDDNKILAGRKKRLDMGYKLAFMTYMASSAWSLSIMTSKTNRYVFNYVFGGGPFNMAVILYILKGAASSDRLSRDTYKRLNIAVISNALVQLVIPIGSLGWQAWSSFKVPAFLALVNGIKGYGYGCLGWDKSKETSTVLTDLKEGIQSTLKGLTVVKAKSAGYLFGTLVLGSMSCLKLKELCSLFFSVSETTINVPFYSALSKLARIGLMTTIMYTLKDASDRDRLSGNTFIKLNLLAAASFLSTVLFLLPTSGNLLANAQILVAGALSVMTAYKGLFRYFSNDSYL